jgi:signal transduction histidine kinase
VSADGSRVVQALGNLVRNALKFTPNGGRITLAAEARDGAVVFAVSDTGRGIGEDNQRRIFDRYWQSSDGARARGSGLGLSIAQGIVQAHGGRIWVESSLGKGSMFAFTIPRAPG